MGSKCHGSILSYAVLCSLRRQIRTLGPNSALHSSPMLDSKIRISNHSNSQKMGGKDLYCLMKCLQGFVLLVAYVSCVLWPNEASSYTQSTREWVNAQLPPTTYHLPILKTQKISKHQMSLHGSRIIHGSGHVGGLGHDNRQLPSSSSAKATTVNFDGLRL